MSAMKPAAAAGTGGLQTALLAALCLVVPFLLYWPSLQAPFVFDDYTNIVDNADLRKPDAFGSLLQVPRRIERNRHYPARPVSFISFTMNYRWNGLDPSGYRLFNIAVHSLNTVLVFCLTLLMFRRLQVQEFAAGSAAAVALLFSVHPLATEAVAYISHRADSLAACFYLLSMLCFFAGSDRPAAAPRRWVWLSLCAVFFVLGVASKEWAITLPAAVLLMDFLILSPPERPRLARHAPLWILAFALTAARIHFTGRLGFLGRDIDQVWTPLAYFTAQTYVWLKYVGLWFLPLWQTFDHYLVPGAPDLGRKMFASAALWSAALLSCSFLLHRMGWDKMIGLIRREWEDHRRKLIWFGGVLIAILLAPTSSFLPAYEAMAERRLYLSLWAAALVWVVVLARLIKNASRLKAVLTVHILFLALLTWKRGHLYLSPEKLWAEAAERYPENPGAQNNLGVILMKSGHPDKALHHWLHAIELLGGRSPMSYNNIGEFYFQRGEHKKAVEYFKEAARQDPGMHYAWRNMGDSYYELGDAVRAQECYARAIAAAPLDPELHSNLGMILERLGKYPDAERAYLKAIELDPNFTAARANLAELYVQTEQFPKALPQFEIWASLDSSNLEIPQKIAVLRRWMADQLRGKK